MNPAVELILVLLLVGAAAATLGRRFYRFVRQAGQGASACGSSCGGCSTKAEHIKSSLKPLVQLDLNKEKSSSVAGR